MKATSCLFFICAVVMIFVGFDTHAADHEEAIRSDLLIALKHQCTQRAQIDINALARLGLLDYRGADGHQETLLMTTIESRDMGSTKLLLKAGANPNASDDDSFTPLMTACKYSDILSAKLLLENGAKINVVDSNGLSPLILAIESRNAPLVQLLLAHGADPAIGNQNGKSCALMASIEDANMKNLPYSHPSFSEILRKSKD